MEFLDLAGGVPLREYALGFLVFAIIALLLLAVAFGLYTVFLRTQNQRREARWQALTDRWQEPVLLAIADPDMTPAVHEAVDPPDRLHFVRFCLEYARRVKGEERSTIQALALPYLEPLAERAQHRSVEIRTRAVQTLGTLGLPEYADVVVGALDDEAPVVSMVAARSLAQGGFPEHAGAILTRLKHFQGWSRSFMASMLATMGPDAAPELRTAFADHERDPWVRAVAGTALTQLKDLATGDIAAQVVDVEDDPIILEAALRLLTVVAAPHHLDVIRKRCASPHASVRSHALRALGTLAEEDDVPRLLGAMADPSPWVAIHAAQGLLEAGKDGLLRDLAESDHPRAVLAGQVLLEEVD